MKKDKKKKPKVKVNISSTCFVFGIIGILLYFIGMNMTPIGGWISPASYSGTKLLQFYIFPAVYAILFIHGLRKRKLGALFGRATLAFGATLLTIFVSGLIIFKVLSIDVIFIALSGLFFCMSAVNFLSNYRKACEE